MNTLRHKEMEKLMASESPAVPLLARQELQVVSTDEALNFLLPIVTREVQSRQEHRYAAYLLGMIFLVWQVIFLISLYGASLKPAFYGVSAWIIFIVGGALTVAQGTTLKRFRHQSSSLREQNAAVALAEFSDPRIVGPLLDTLAVAPREIHSLLIPALTEQLGELRREDLQLLLEDQRCAILRQELRKLPADPNEMETDFGIAAMKALALVGDVKSRKIVQHLTQRKTDTFHNQVIGDAAKECLKLLETEVTYSAGIRRTLFELFGGRRETPATVALQESYLSTLGPERAKLALVAFVQEGCRRQRYAGMLRLPVQMILIGMAGLFLYASIKKNTLSLGMLGLAFSLALSGASEVLLRPGRKFERAASRLSRYADKSIVGTLLDAYQHQWLKTTFNMQITNLLMQFTPADALLLNSEQRQYLRQQISFVHFQSAIVEVSSSSQVLFTIAAIHALSIIGDTESQSAIEKAAHQHPVPAIREAAEKAARMFPG